MDTIDALAERFLGRKLNETDGSPLSEIDRAERRLGYSLPQSIRQYYARCGRVARFNQSHNLIRELHDIVIEDGYLVFMDENQSVVSWGIPLTHITEADPAIWQRNNAPPVAWYSEEKTWLEFLSSMFSWYVEAEVWE